MEDEKITQAIKRGLPFELAEDFRSRYANNVFYETSVFDIKLDFGEVMQLPGQDPYIEQHTSITLSWLEAKLAVLFLAVNVATQEKRFGTIPIPEGLIPSYFQKSAEEGKLPLTKWLEFIEQRPVPSEPTPSGTADTESTATEPSASEPSERQ